MAKVQIVYSEHHKKYMVRRRSWHNFPFPSWGYLIVYPYSGAFSYHGTDTSCSLFSTHEKALESAHAAVKYFDWEKKSNELHENQMRNKTVIEELDI